MKLNNLMLPNTNITIKDFKKLLYNEFKAYPMMFTNYKNNTFTIKNTFYENIDITQHKLVMFCDELKINYVKCIDGIKINLINSLILK